MLDVANRLDVGMNDMDASLARVASGRIGTRSAPPLASLGMCSRKQIIGAHVVHPPGSFPLSAGPPPVFVDLTRTHNSIALTWYLTGT